MKGGQAATWFVLKYIVYNRRVRGTRTSLCVCGYDGKVEIERSTARYMLCIDIEIM